MFAHDKSFQWMAKAVEIQKSRKVQKQIAEILQVLLLEYLGRFVEVESMTFSCKYWPDFVNIFTLIAILGQGYDNLLSLFHNAMKSNIFKSKMLSNNPLEEWRETTRNWRNRFGVARKTLGKILTKPSEVKHIMEINTIH